MKRIIADVIAGAAFIIVVGTPGAIEAGNIGLTQALIQMLTGISVFVLTAYFAGWFRYGK